MTDPIRIVVADDHPLFRRGVADFLGAEDGCMVVGEAASGEEAARMVEELAPDILVIDLDMPGIGGIAAIGAVAARSPSTTTLVLTVSEREEDLLRALKAGARGYVLKGTPPHGLAHAVRSVAGGEVYVSPALASTILYDMTHDHPGDPLSALTDREAQVLRLVGEGLTNREIGERLFLSEKTIKHYMTGVLQKLQARSRVEAALIAQQHRAAEGGATELPR